MSLESIRPRGTFHARRTRDATARERDGQTYVLMNELHDVTGAHPTVEVMFEDGTWMLATPEDLDTLL